MSQFDDPRLDEVKRVLRRVQGIGDQSSSRQRRVTLSAALAAARTEPEDPIPPRPPVPVARAMQETVGMQRTQPSHDFRIMLILGVLSAVAGILTVFLTFGNVS